MNILFDWINSPGVQKVIELMKLGMNVIRWVVPIGLIIMTSWDLFTKVLDPDNKDAQKKIMNRAIAAVIVFFVPTIVNLIMRLVDIGKGGSSIGSNNGGNSQTVVEKESVIKITNCPSMSVNVGDNISLNASITNYSGKLTWNTSEKDKTSIVMNNDGTNAYFGVSSYPNGGKIVVSVSGNGKTATCNINVNKPEITGETKILNCPSSDKVYKKGDVITLNAEGPNNFDGSLVWIISPSNIFKSDVSNNGKTVTINVLDYYAMGFNIFSVSGGGKTTSCKINFHPSENISGDVKITGCTYEKMKVGDSFTISANNVKEWSGIIFEKYYEIIDNHDNTATIKILNHFSNELRANVMVRDNDNKTGMCSFYTTE